MVKRFIVHETNLINFHSFLKVALDILFTVLTLACWAIEPTILNEIFGKWIQINVSCLLAIQRAVVSISRPRITLFNALGAECSLAFGAFFRVVQHLEAQIASKVVIQLLTVVQYGRVVSKKFVFDDNTSRRYLMELLLIHVRVAT